MDSDIYAEDVRCGIDFLNMMHDPAEGGASYEVTDKGVEWALGWLGSLLRTDRLMVDEGDQGFIVALQIVADEAVRRGVITCEDIPNDDDVIQVINLDEEEDEEDE